MSVISVDRLRVDYGSFTAVDQISFDVEEGELFALIGTNGAGKTSTLESLEGHREPTDGQISVWGGPPRNIEVRARVGMMLQDGGFLPDLTALESLELFGCLSGRLDDPQALLEEMGLADKADTHVSDLSGGERRRLEFACAAYGDAELLILDEPTTGLDIHSRDRVWRRVARMRRDGTTVLMTTHNLQEAQQYADRVAVMHQGKIERIGTVSEVVDEVTATIRLRRPATEAPLPFTVDEERPGELVVHTRQLQGDLRVLLNWAHIHDVELERLAAVPSDLDDLFRELTIR